MDADSPKVTLALELVYSAPLLPCEHMLLKLFIKDAVECDRAAEYIIERVSVDDQQTVDTSQQVRRILDDWILVLDRCDTALPLVYTFIPRTNILGLVSPSSLASPSRDVHSSVWARDKVCVVTGQIRHPQLWRSFFIKTPFPTCIVPPDAVLGLHDTVHEGQQRGLLQAFLSDDLLMAEDILRDISLDGELRNAMIMNSPAARAFNDGVLLLNRNSTISDYKKKNVYMMSFRTPGLYPNLKTVEGKGIASNTRDMVIFDTVNAHSLPSPSDILFVIRTRLATSIRWQKVRKQVVTGRSIGSKILALTNRMLISTNRFTVPWIRTIWRLVPQIWRVKVYDILIAYGKKMYGPQLDWVQRVPFGMYIKYSRVAVKEGEPAALLLVEKQTKVPAPLLVDVVTVPIKPIVIRGVEYGKTFTYMVMTELPGQTFENASPFMTYAELAQLSKDLSSCIAQFRCMQNPNTLALCNATGGPLFDYRLPREHTAGPFENEEQFETFLCGRPKVVKPAHSIFFTHADFNPSNILIDNGRLSAIIDFGCAGFYPEYWEYTKAVRNSTWGPWTPWNDVIQDVFAGQYAEELECEREHWKGGLF